ncbi:MAG: hypothetical protein QM759_18125 [Terricaulis sp.]
MKLKRGGSSKFWAALFRARLARAHMPFWRVVVEAKLDRRVKRWPSKFDSAVAAVFVWGRTIEEAEGLASLALEEEGLVAVTADAKKCEPAAAPRKTPAAVARTDLGFLERIDSAGAKPSRSRA